MQACRLYFLLQRVNLLLRPEFPRLLVVQHCNDALHISRLTNLLQGHRVEL